MNYRLLLIIVTLLPMVIYYLLLGMVPQHLATSSILTIPSSLFLGVAVMFWGVLMAIIYVIIHQNRQQHR